MSCTTRLPRGGEQHGREYLFVSVEEFERRIAAGDFLEHAKYNGNYYGTPRQFVEEQLAAGQDVLLTIEVQGAAQVMQRVRSGGFAYPDALVTIFLMPPTLELLERRLRKRGTDSGEAIRKRLAVATQEMAHWREYDYAIVTGHIDEDVAYAKAILIAEKCRTARSQKDGKPWQRNKLSF
jgi:guanylate kinase